MSSNNSLTQLTVNGLRGVALPLEIPFEKRMTLVYGENGTGKTSICDAFDFIGNGQVGSVTDIGLGSATHSYWPFLGKGHGDISVSLTSAGGSCWQAKANGKIVNVIPLENRPLVKVWRRHQLIKLILAKPSDRFDVIKPFVDTSAIDTSEKQLKSHLKTVNAELNEAGQQIGQNVAMLSEQARLAGATNVDEVSWARDELRKPQENIDSEIDKLTNIESALSEIAVHSESFKQIKESLEEKILAENKAVDSFNDALKNVSDDAEETLAIMEAAQHYFHRRESVDACPLCQSDENAAGLAERVEGQVANLGELRGAKSQLDLATRSRSTVEERLNQEEGLLSQLAEQLKEELQGFSDFPESQKVLGALTDKAFEVAGSNQNLSTVKSNVSTRKASLSEQKGRRDALKVALEQYEKNVQSQAKNEKLAPIAQQLLEIHEEERKRFIDEILISIADEVGRLYEQIHQGEGLNKIALQLDPKRRASLEISADYLQQNVPPGAYFSNSHLDSLGLCILIALAKRENPENTIIVMDDILGSIDEPHVDRLIQLLYDESQTFLQTVITTHYYAWHLKIRRGQLTHPDCGVVELRKWNAQTGVALQGTARPLLDILRDNVLDRPNEIEPIAANAGHLLEQIGDFLTLHYGCSVPRRKAGNTLNEYLCALKANFIKQLRVEVLQPNGTYLDVSLQPVFEELKNIYQVRNTSGAHYNDHAKHVPPNNVLRFGELVVQLCDSLICSENGFPTQARKHTYWSPKNNETRRLYPFAKP